MDSEYETKSKKTEMTKELAPPSAIVWQCSSLVTTLGTYDALVPYV
jgi:hypothetical protein